MELFAITTVDEFSGASALGVSIFPAGGSSYMKVGGLYNSTDGKWYVFNPTQRPLFSGAAPGNYTAGNDCLRIFSFSNGYYLTGFSCTSSYHSFCEYI